MKEDKAEWVPMTPQRIAEVASQFVSPGLPRLHFARVVEDAPSKRRKGRRDRRAR